MQDEEVLKNESEVFEDLSPPPLSDEWIPLIEASRILGLKSIRQVYRRITKHNIQQKRLVSGTRVRSYVRREDVEKSRKRAWEEAQLSDMPEGISDATSGRRQDSVGLEVATHVIPQVKEFISNAGNELKKIEVVKGLLADLLTLTKEEMEERKEERRERSKEREASIKAKEQARRADVVRLISYIVVIIAFCGFVGFLFWKFRLDMPIKW